ncbi:uncharacterized protein LOC101178035 isoform X2 [Nomascus leucogenys]|uniref:uncharacterized protein LOC101178035 isoform X2 n=1 Tax=Nomascus leucogenys TaxID=61853 RepID=UPI00122D8538|nr:uncharacterized protein LOC101178035 isoform X2 [Nomascus leucogenys]
MPLNTCLEQAAPGLAEHPPFPGLQRTALPLPFSSPQARPPPSQIFWCQWRKERGRQLQPAQCGEGPEPGHWLHSPWVKGLSLAVISLSSSTLHGTWHTQASWKRPQEFRPGSSKRNGQVGGASRAHRRPLWHTCAQRPVWAAKRRGVWREGLRATSQSGPLEGGLARRALGEAPVGVCFLTPGSERWPPSLQAPRARLSQLLGAQSSAHLAPSVARASAGRSSVRRTSAHIMAPGFSLVLSVPGASRSGPPPPATIGHTWPSAPTPAPNAARPSSTGRRSHPLLRAHRGEALRVRQVLRPPVHAAGAPARTQVPMISGEM